MSLSKIQVFELSTVFEDPVSGVIKALKLKEELKKESRTCKSA